MNKSNNNNEFKKYLNLIMENLANEGYNVEKHIVHKNNSQDLTGIVVRNIPNNSNMAPVIYIDPFWVNGVAVEKTVEKIKKIIKGTSAKMPANVPILLDDFANVKDKIFFKLVNWEKNQKRLLECPHIRMKDLAVEFRVCVDILPNGVSSAQITYLLLKKWGVEKDDIIVAAADNTSKLFPVQILDMNSFLMGYIAYGDIDPEELIPMYILTNRSMLNGASCIFYENIKDELEKAGITGNFYALPSSIHEMILVPEEYVPEPNGLKDLVPMANKAVVSNEDFLSDYVYYYNMETGELTICE